MLITTLLTFASAAAACACASPVGDKQWLPGDHRAIPVVRELQPQMMKRLGASSLISIDAPLAKTASGNQSVPAQRHYYLAKVAYVSTQRPPSGYPSGIAIAVDIDSNGIAYVTSHRLTREHGSSEFSVVIISESPIRGVVSLCRAAE